MHKFFDYLEPDLPVNVIRDLLGYIRRFAALFSGGVPVEGAMDGVGRVQVMLTLRSGETLSLAEDSSATLGSGGDVRQDSQVLTVNRGSGKQEVVVTQRLYPTYQGAVVVCQGAGDSRVRLRVMETVAVLTGLSSDKISVVQWKQ